MIEQTTRSGLATLDQVGVLPLGAKTCRLFAGTGQGVRWLGWSTNLQSSFGVSLVFRQRLANWLSVEANMSMPNIESDGHLRRGLRANGKAELLELLRSWLAASTATTIGDASDYGGKPWLYAQIDGYDLALNADTRRDAVAEAVRANTADVAWPVIANRFGKVNKVLPGPMPDLPGWYAYLRKPWSSAGWLGTPSTAAFVQFPHPGPEHRPQGDDMGWNTGRHGRKFASVTGRYIDATGAHRHGDVVCWVEWEPPSTIEQRWPRSGQLPSALHRLYWYDATGSWLRQNTDPWVWGARMLYSNCKQLIGHERRPTSMQTLGRGSVLCFGSAIGQEFCLDTVLVVADAQPWTPADADDLDVDDAFKVCSARPLTTTPSDANSTFTLYRGATFDDPVDGMFSFVPAVPAHIPDPRFPRPAIQLPELINPASRQSTFGSRRRLPITTIQDAWASVRDQVLDADLQLAVELEIPEQRSGARPGNA